LDVLLTGSQKALALPPGLALFTCSPAAFARAAAVPGRGYYFDFLEFKKNAEGNMTPSTPSIGHIYALQSKLADLFAEGLEERYARHRKLAQMTRDWAARQGFTLFPEPGFVSLTLTCVNNGAKPGGRVIDAEKLVNLVKKRGFLINGGYGKIKGTTFRISNMGDETEATMQELFGVMDEALKEM
jgi:aspartate aminotransferase-like enzyme